MKFSYRNKIPCRYDKNSEKWRQGAHRNWRRVGVNGANADREFLMRRETRYHKFTEVANVRTIPAAFNPR